MFRLGPFYPHLVADMVLHHINPLLFLPGCASVGLVSSASGGGGSLMATEEGEEFCLVDSGALQGRSNTLSQEGVE
jgi:hypothetical protein